MAKSAETVPCCSSTWRHRTQHPQDNHSTASAPPPPTPPPHTLLVSRSGKAAGSTLNAHKDFVLVTDFSNTHWRATYMSPSCNEDNGRDGEGRDGGGRGDVKPSSDTPLLHAALVGGAGGAYRWSECPRVAVHGHALAAGEGLEYARSRGLPISERATLFSTPEDLVELEALFVKHPYPQHRCDIRKGHGFFVLGGSVDECAKVIDEVVVPFMRGDRTG